MLSVVVFTYNRPGALEKCINSIKGGNIGEILIFNDDETQNLEINYLPKSNTLLRIFNPSDFELSGRIFRKPIYINKAVELASFDKILLSDDDGIFSANAIDLHHRYLENHKFVAGSIIRDQYFNQKSKTILQGTNYSFHKDFFKKVGGYNENFSLSAGGGDPEFWFRIYNYVKKNNISVAYVSSAIQKVIGKKSRKRKNRQITPIKIFQEIHNFQPEGKMYKWFPEIRKKSNWMSVISK